MGQLLWQQERATPELRVLSRDQGRDHLLWRERHQGPVQAVDLVHDFLVLSRADSTWKMYSSWWGVFVEWCQRAGLEMVQANGEGMRREMEASVAVLGKEYAASTMGVYAAAVSQRFRWLGWGELREGSCLSDLLKGIERWWGKEVDKKRPVEAQHIRMLLEMEQPEGWLRRVWQHAVAMVGLMWLCGLRPKEARYLSACDMRWNAEGVEVAVNRTKNDQEGYKRSCNLVYSDRRELCMLRWVHGYARDRGFLVQCRGCTNAAQPTLECRICPRFFENELASGVVRNSEDMWGMPEYRPSAVVKLLFGGLAAVGLIRREELEGYSARSCRAGAVSAAAAGGVRAQVAAEHLRMRSEMTLKAYDRVLGQERGAASRVLQGAVEAAAQATRRHFE